MKAKLLLLILFSMVLCSFAYAEYNYTEGLVSYYSLDNQTNDNYNGIWNATNYGTDCATNITGILGTSCEWNSANDRIVVNTKFANDTYTAIKGGTICNWFNADTIAGLRGLASISYIISTYSSTGADGVYYALEDDPCIYMNDFNYPTNSISRTIGNPAPSTLRWIFVCMVYNGTRAGKFPLIYINGTIAVMSNETTSSGTFEGADFFNLTFGNRGTDYARTFDGKLDEIAFWNRSLSANEVLALYNNNTAGYSLYNMSGGINPPTPSDNPPTVTLLLPANATSTTNTTFNFSCSATDDNLVQNVTFYINSTGSFTANETNATTGNGNYSFNKNLSIGNYIWNCYACDNASQCSWGSANYSLEITAVPPVPPVKYLIKFVNSTVNLMFGWVNHNGVIGTNTSIAFANRTADPEPISGYGQIFAKNENLFYLMPNGSLYRVNLTWVS